MELRRALLLFAIVLGVAAIVTSFSAPAEREEPARPERADPGARVERGKTVPRAISFSTTGKPRAERLGAGRPGVVVVEVARPGQVELRGLGLSAAAEPLTPARLDVYERRTGSYDVRFTPAQSSESRVVGRLEIVE